MIGGRLRGVTASPTLALAVMLITAQLVVRGIVAGRGFFYWDDLILISRAGEHPPWSPALLLYDHDGHLMPGAFALSSALTRIDPWGWALPAASLVVLQLLASLAVLRLLWVLLGPRPALLAPLIFYLFSPLTLPSFAWWANGLNQLPMQAGTAWVITEAVLLVRTGRTRHAVGGTAGFLAALVMTEQALLIPVIAVAATMLALRARGHRRVWRRTWRAGAPLWWPLGLLTAAWTVLYLVVVDSRLDPEHLTRLPQMLHHGLSLGLVPTLIGGPGAWDRWPPSPPWATPPTALVVLAWLVIAAVVAVSLLRRRRVGGVWPATAVYVLASLTAMVLGRAADETAGELAQTLRYFADASVVLTVAGAIVLSAPRRPWPSALPAPPRIPAPARRVLAGAAAIVFVALSIVSTVSFDARWRDNPTVDYVAQVRASLATADRGTALLSQPVSIWVLLPVASPHNESARLFSLLDRRPEFGDWTEQLQLLDDDGRLVPGRLLPVRDTLPGPVPDCGARVTGPRAPVDPGRTGELVLTEGVLEWEWTVALNYLADQDGAVTVSMPLGQSVQVPVRAGLHTVYVRLVGGGQSLRVAADSPDLNLCLGSAALGSVVAAEDAP